MSLPDRDDEYEKEPPDGRMVVARYILIVAALILTLVAIFG